jgi:hypothetical protein
LSALFPPLPEPLAEVRPGAVVRVRGRVVPRDLIASPLTGDRCVYYQYAVEQWRQSKVAGVLGDGFWELRETDEAITEFYLQDDTGSAIIAPARARVERGRGVEMSELSLGPERRAHQLLIAPGDEIEVRAKVDRADDLFDEGRGYRTSPTRLILHAPEDGEILLRLI